MVVNSDLEHIFEACKTVSIISLPAYKPHVLNIEYENNDCDKVFPVNSEIGNPFANSDVFYSRISTSRRLTAVDEECKAVYEVAFDIKGSNFVYNPGDTIGILPQNSAADVNAIISHLSLEENADLSYVLSIDNNFKGKIPPHIPVKSTLRHIFTHCLDLRSVLKKLFLLALSRYTKDENERKVLEYLCSKEGSPNYNKHILNKHFSILDLFSEFKTCKPPVEVLLAYLPRLLPRPYSIVNSQLTNTEVLKICFSVMILNSNRKGLTTGWLEEIILSKDSIEDKLATLNIRQDMVTSLEKKVPIYLRKNITGFAMPEDVTTPMILIGPGTGVAPFIGFLEEREQLAKITKVELGCTWLFFGCRNSQLDFIYKNELNDFVKNGVLNKLSTAISREDSCTVKYVQDALLQNGEDIVKMIRNGAVVFVCGDLNVIAAQIMEVLIQCFVKFDGQSQEDSEKFISQMKKDKKYIVDVWS